MEAGEGGMHVARRALAISDEEVRIVLMGKTGVGKSATGNTILGSSEAFESKALVQSLTTKCEKVRGVLAGRNVSVVDTPDLFHSKVSENTTLDEIKQCICFAAPGPHVFLILIKLGGFTDEEKKSVEMIQKVFGEMSAKYSMILFTHGDEAEDETADEMLNNSPELQELISKCGGRYHVFNNNTKDPSQVTELLEKINKMLKKNGGSHYTTEMFQDVEKEIEEEKERILQQMDWPEEEAREEAERRNAFIGEGIDVDATPLADSGIQCDAWQGAVVGAVFGNVALGAAKGRVSAAPGQQSEQERGERLKKLIEHGTELGRAVGALFSEEGKVAGGAIGGGVGAIAHLAMRTFQ